MVRTAKKPTALRAPTAGPADAGRRPEPLTALRALVVDDEPDLVTVVAAYLERDGFEVFTAVDGVEALAAAREHRPDVVILDLAMPRLDGIEACRRLRTFSDAFVIMLTARSDETDALAGLAAGADDYLTKPFSPRILLAKVRTVLRRPRPEPARRLPGIRW